MEDTTLTFINTGTETPWTITTTVSITDSTDLINWFGYTPINNKKLSLCNNGVLNIGEVCDDGPDDISHFRKCKEDCSGFANGFDSDFNKLRNWHCSEDIMRPCSKCGDGKLQDLETCDDGLNDNQGCNSTCTGLLPKFACGGGNSTSPSICTISCKSILTKLLTYGPGEFCDDGNKHENDGCSSECKKNVGAVCSKVKNMPYDCNFATCGNSKLDSGETCDDGNIEPGDGCNSHCQTELFYTCDHPGD